MSHMKAITHLKLPVSFLKEGKKFIAYSPALNLSTSGKTFEQAQNNFAEAVELFFEEIIEAGTLEEVLLELGWVKENKNLVPPLVVAQKMESFKVPQFK